MLDFLNFDDPGLDCRQCFADADKVAMRMILCPICGNKRCPKADNHRYKCTGSNDVGQVGEWENPPQENEGDQA